MPHETNLVVRSYECDEYGHVNHAVYLNYLEHARVEYLEAVGLPYRLLRREGWGVVISEIHIRYRSPLLPGERLTILTQPLEVGTVSGVFQQDILVDGQLRASARVRWAFVDRMGRPARLSEEQRQALLQFKT